MSTRPDPLPSSLDGRPFSYFRPLFTTLAAPREDALHGVYRGVFTGPAWLRLSAGPSLALGGLGGWWGKDFLEGGAGLNLAQHKGRLVRLFPFCLVPCISLVDARPGLAVQYTRDCPFPWPHVRDELRKLDDTTLLGMTTIVLGPLRRLAFPFLLIPWMPSI
jgi:hypothetical protein